VVQDLTQRAEQAALGAMIAERQMAVRLSYLQPADFTDPRHRWMLRTVRQLSAAPQSTPSGNWGELIAQAAGRWATRKYLDDLGAACPDPAHGPAYGAMLVQATIYRQARDHADQMDAQAAQLRAEGSRLIEAGEPGPTQAASLGALLAEVAKAIRGHTAVLASVGPDVGPRRGTGLAPAGPTSVRADQREELVLSAILREHPQAGQILSYLPAAAFTSPARQEVFRAARRLNQSGRPVDELTVSWELATYSAVTAVLSPGNTSQPQVPDEYISRLARTGVSDGRSPLGAAHDLDARLRHRTSRVPRPAAGAIGGQAQDVPVQAVAPLIRPQNPAESRPAGPEHKR
jgi:hypothetical protein